MPPNSGHLKISAVLLFALACTAAAHGHDVSPAMNMAEDARPAINTTNMEPESYSQLRDHTGILFTHIALMTVAWVFILPIGMRYFSSFLLRSVQVIIDFGKNLGLLTFV